MIFGIISVIVLVALDQLAKWAAVKYLMPYGVLPAIDGVFQWQYLENDGAAFSLFAGRQVFLLVFTGIALLVLAIILMFRRPKDEMETTGLVFIFAGGVGNLIDRMAQGYVVDYISLLFMDFAVFNLADIYVTCGFVVFVCGMIRSEIRTKRRRAARLKAIQEEEVMRVQAKTMAESEVGMNKQENENHGEN